MLFCTFHGTGSGLLNLSNNVSVLMRAWNNGNVIFSKCALCIPVNTYIYIHTSKCIYTYVSLSGFTRICLCRNAHFCIVVVVNFFFFLLLAALFIAIPTLFPVFSVAISESATLTNSSPSWKPYVTKWRSYITYVYKYICTSSVICCKFLAT